MEYEVKQLLSPKLYNDILSITEGGTEFSRFENKTVLVTGAGQLLGIYIACAFLINNDLHGANTRVIAVDADEQLFQKYAKLNYREDLSFIVSSDYSALHTEKADFVIHTDSFKKLDGTEAISNLLGFIRNNSAASIIVNSADLYGDVFNGKDYITETDMGYIDCQKSSHGELQLERTLETLALRLAREENLNIKLARASRIFGAVQTDGENRFGDIILKALQGKNIVIDLKRSKPESFCYVTDAAEAIFKVLLEGRFGEVYNISAPFAISELTLAKACEKLFSEYKPSVITKNSMTPVSPMAPTLRILDCKRIISLGVRPRVSLENGILRAAAVIAEVM